MRSVILFWLQLPQHVSKQPECFPSYILCSTTSFISFIGQESKWLLYQYISYIKAICQLNYSNTFSQYGISRRSNSIVILQKFYQCPMWLKGKGYSAWQLLLTWRDPKCIVVLLLWVFPRLFNLILILTS